VVLLLIGVLGMLNLMVLQQRAFLNLYYLPVVLASYWLGRRKGVGAAVLAVLVVVWFALIDPANFANMDPQIVTFLTVTKPDLLTREQVEVFRWLDITLWGSFLILTSYAVGTLYDHKQQAFSEVRQAYEGVLQILSKFIDCADRYTEAHSIRVAGYAEAIARELGVKESEVEDIRVAAMLHDVGKLDVSIDVIRKASSLNDEEWAQIREHPALGANIVRSVGGVLRNAVPIILAHHEQYDGSGYYRLKGDDIPLGARVVAVADAFDAITTDRPYQKGRSTREAMQQIESGSGQQFDPEVVDAFHRAVRNDEGLIVRLRAPNAPASQTA
jgi:putative nucleotidyltransferase with HDIG domain